MCIDDDRQAVSTEEIASFCQSDWRYIKGCINWSEDLGISTMLEQLQAQLYKILDKR